MRRSLFALTAAVTISFAPTAFAQNVEQAKELFEAGAQYYNNGQFAAAIQAFEAANKIVPKPAIEFSIAQAHRRQYFLDKNPDHLNAAIRMYQDYMAKGGARSADAAQALEELQTIAGRMTAEERAAAAKGPAKEPPRIMVMSQTPGAQVTLDQKLTKPIPFGPDVTAGQHHVHVFAPGYFDFDQEVQAFENTVTPVNADLREKPARLTFDAPSNATISIDGRFAGTTPLPAPLELPSGRHLVVVTKQGHKAWSQTIDLKRDQRLKLAVDLHISGQRMVADSLLISGVVWIAAGATFTAVSFVELKNAQNLDDKRNTVGLNQQEAADYEFYKSARNRWATVAGISYGIGAASLLTGVVFFIFDTPSVSLPPERFENNPAPDKTQQPKPNEPLEMGFSPVGGPGFAGASLYGRF